MPNHPEHSLELAHHLATEDAIRHCLNLHHELQCSTPQMGEALLSKAFQTYHNTAQTIRHFRETARNHQPLPVLEAQLLNSASLLPNHVGSTPTTHSVETIYQRWTDYIVYSARAQHLSSLLQSNSHPRYEQDLENACRADLNSMHATTPANTAQSWQPVNPYITPDVTRVLQQANL